MFTLHWKPERNERMNDNNQSGYQEYDETVENERTETKLIFSSFARLCGKYVPICIPVKSIQMQFN